MTTLQAALGKPVLFHWVGWHGKTGLSSSLTGYDSRNPGVINRQLEAMLALGGPGSGVVALTYGPTVSPFIHEASMAMCNQCNAKGMPFALCFDPWTVRGQLNPNTAMITALQNEDIQLMLNSPSYLTLGNLGKTVLDFSTGADAKSVMAGVPGIEYWMKNVDYDWVNIPQTPNATRLPCIYMEFDDGTGANRNMQVWDQSLPVRLIPSLAGSTLWNRNVTGGKLGTGPGYVQFATWNDVSEGTDIEKFGAMLVGPI